MHFLPDLTLQQLPNCAQTVDRICKEPICKMSFGQASVWRILLLYKGALLTTSDWFVPHHHPLEHSYESLVVSPLPISLSLSHLPWFLSASPFGILSLQDLVGIPNHLQVSLAHLFMLTPFVNGACLHMIFHIMNASFAVVVCLAVISL